MGLYGAIETAIQIVVKKLRPAKLQPAKAEDSSDFTAENKYYVGKMAVLVNTIRRKPWLFLLVAGEDGFFFLPLLYIGITPLSATVAMGIFTLMHFREKPISALPPTFLFCVANVLIVLPHGILPMVIGHALLDAIAFSIIPKLKRKIDAEEKKKKLADKPSALSPEAPV